MDTQLEFYKGNGFVAKIIRTSRIKTASVKVEEGKVSVVVPQNLTDNGIEKLVKGKTRWIREKIYLHRQSAPSKSKEYISGESFSYLGRNYRLKLETRASTNVRLVNGRLLVSLPKASRTSANIQMALTGWYKSHAEQKLQEKVKRYAEIVGVKPVSVGISDFKSRWGSCHTNGKIQFNWKIVIAPNRVVDYVVVHELCHMKHHDHSPKFWKLVSKVMPDYLDCKEWLKENGMGLSV